MKNLLAHFIYSFCIIFLIVFSVISYHNNDVLESRINSLTKNAKDFSSERSFKEDYYISQQSSDTTLLLVVFPIIVGFVSLFTYKNILDKVITYESNINNKIKKKETEWNENHNLILELKTRIDLDSSQVSFSQSSYFFHKKEYDYYLIINSGSISLLWLDIKLKSDTIFFA